MIALPMLPALVVALLGVWAIIGSALLLGRASKRQRVVVGVVLTIGAVLPALAPMAGFFAPLVLLLGALVTVLLMLLLVAMRLLRRKPRLGLLLPGYALALLGATMQLSAPVLGLRTPPVPSGMLAPSDELQYLYTADQNDRYAGLWYLSPQRDEPRLERVLELDDQGLIATPQDRYHAAMVLQHGRCAAHYERAHRLAQAALAGGYDKAAWLTRATFDRWQQSQGKPQKYGTQFGSVAVGVPCP